MSTIIDFLRITGLILTAALLILAAAAGKRCGTDGARDRAHPAESAHDTCRGRRGRRLTQLPAPRLPALVERDDPDGKGNHRVQPPPPEHGIGDETDEHRSRKGGTDRFCAPSAAIAFEPS